MEQWEMALDAARKAVNGLIVSHWSYFRGNLDEVWKKSYEEKESAETDKKKESLNVFRMKGYQTVILFGLGSIFWTIASSVMADTHKRLSELPGYEIVTFDSTWTLDVASSFILYCGASLAIMICGLIASTFHRSSPFAAAVAGFGALKACVFVLATAHAASLKFHDEASVCLYSLIVWTTVVTFYWSFSAQDPKLFHVLAKLLLLLVCALAYSLCFLTVAVTGFSVAFVILMLSWLADGFLKLKDLIFPRSGGNGGGYRGV